MSTLACVNVKGFPLQLLLKRRPGWADLPAAVVSHERPQGRLLWINEKARGAGVKTGMTCAGALGLCSSLRAGAVSGLEIGQAIASLEDALRELTPEVEPSTEEPGVFWLNAGGLRHLWPSLKDWGKAVRARLAGEGFDSAVVVGYTRFGTYALACALGSVPTADGGRVLALSSSERESELACKVPVDLLNLNLTVDARNALVRLNIKTVGAFAALPASGVLQRFGPEAHRLHRMATGDLELPLQPVLPSEPLRAFVHLDSPEQNSVRLLFLVKRLLHPLLGQAADRHVLVTELHLHMELEGGFLHDERIRPAEPTRNAALLLELIRLRLEAVPLPSGVTTLVVQLEARRFTRKQLELFVVKPRRPLDSANRALARIRAEFGESAVVAARIKPGHLPEARFAWEPLPKLGMPRVPPRPPPPARAPEDTPEHPTAHTPEHPTARAPDRAPEPSTAHPPTRTLIRRLIEKPVPLPCSPISDPKSSPISDSASFMEHFGPYVISGGWWAGEERGEVHREYHFVQTRGGDLVWVYYDRKRDRWYLQGRVE